MISLLATQTTPRTKHKSANTAFAERIESGALSGVLFILEIYGCITRLASTGDKTWICAF